MTEEELREKIVLLIRQGVIDGKLSLTIADQILEIPDIKRALEHYRIMRSSNHDVDGFYKE